MSCNDFKHGFFLSESPFQAFACRGSGCPSTDRSQSALLNTSVHVCLIIVTDINNLVMSIYCARECLQANISRASITSKTNGMKIFYAQGASTGSNT